MKKNKQTISLVLGSGGARGYTHIGIINELEKQVFDGGILNPVPILPILSEFTDLVVAVNLNSRVD